MPEDTETAAPAALGPVYTAIETRLRERYNIKIANYLGSVYVPKMTGAIDPSMGGAIRGLGGPVDMTFEGGNRAGKFLVGKTILIGITFPPSDFQGMLELFRSVTDGKGQPAFHYHALKAAPSGGLIGNILDKAEQLATGDLLGLSYDQTSVGLTKDSEERAWGFREIANTYNTEVGMVEATTSTYSGENRHILKFGQTPAAYARKVDITSLHIALTPAACNIHIDNVGFVLRGPRSVVGLDPDFIQHIVNELVWKSMIREALLGKNGESTRGSWAVEHLDLMLPSSDNRYAPMAGLKLDLGSAQLTAAFTMGCKCLQSEPVTVDERIVPIPAGWSAGVGLTKSF